MILGTRLSSGKVDDAADVEGIGTGTGDGEGTGTAWAPGAAPSRTAVARSPTASNFVKIIVIFLVYPLDDTVGNTGASVGAQLGLAPNSCCRPMHSPTLLLPPSAPVHGMPLILGSDPTLPPCEEVSSSGCMGAFSGLIGLKVVAVESVTGLQAPLVGSSTSFAGQVARGVAGPVRAAAIGAARAAAPKSPASSSRREWIGVVVMTVLSVRRLRAVPQD